MLHLCAGVTWAPALGSQDDLKRFAVGRGSLNPRSTYKTKLRYTYSKLFLLLPPVERSELIEGSRIYEMKGLRYKSIGFHIAYKGVRHRGIISMVKGGRSYVC